mmetsp:Transcript_56106/g.131159  ORF Transcript_56106/g.131159 Transcript_56106/m.131159 type:complete len:422 (-) Transcript_56106:637-1902(-)
MVSSWALLCFFAGLVLHGLALRGRVQLRVLHKLSVFFLATLLSSLGFSLQAGKITLDHLQHGDHAATLCTHSLVRLIAKDFGLSLDSLRLCFDKGCGLTRLRIELLQNCQCLRNSSLCLLGVLDCCSVLLLLLVAKLRRVGHGTAHFRKLGLQGSDLLTERGDSCRHFINLGREGVRRICLLLTSCLVAGQFGIAPAFLRGFFVGLVLHLCQKLLNHCSHLGNGVSSHTGCGRGEHAAVQLCRPALQKSGHLLLARGAMVCAQESKSRALHEAGQMFFSAACNSAAGNDLRGLADSHDLLLAELLTLLESLGLLLASGFQICGILLVRSLLGLGLPKISFSGSLALQLFGFKLRLVHLLLLRLGQLGFQALGELIKGMALGLFLFLQGDPLTQEFLLQVFQHANHAARLEVISVRLRALRL